MKNRAFVSLSLSALMLGGTMVGCADGGGHIASAGETTPRAGRQADAAAARAGRELASGRAAAAVPLAEQAVAGRPRVAAYRVLLGQSYLEAGRFGSARQAFADALELDPANGRAALDLALAQVALGDWTGARRTLDADARSIPAADLGLAVALAGDPGTGVDILTAAARSNRADAKTRQNLALALALAGRWPEARAVAATDLSPAALDARMGQWARFARPAGAWDQVAALLGVTPAADPGQPVALALAQPAPATPVRAAEAKPPVADPVEALAATDPAPPATVVPATAPQAAVPVALPAHVAPPVAQPARAAPAPRLAGVRHAVATHAPGTGRWYVQVGAYRNAAVARAGWDQAVRRDAAFRGRVPEQASFRAATGVFYRLAVGGFTHGQADAACRTYRARGGACFVRQGAGDQVASWVRKDTRVANG